MNHSIKDEPTLCIEFSRMEAAWLQAFIQNFPQEFGEEDELSHEYRVELFAILQEFTK